MNNYLFFSLNFEDSSSDEESKSTIETNSNLIYGICDVDINILEIYKKEKNGEIIIDKKIVSNILMRTKNTISSRVKKSTKINVLDVVTFETFEVLKNNVDGIIDFGTYEESYNEQLKKIRSLRPKYNLDDPETYCKEVSKFIYKEYIPKFLKKIDDENDKNNIDIDIEIGLQHIRTDYSYDDRQERVESAMYYYELLYMVTMTKKIKNESSNEEEDEYEEEYYEAKWYFCIDDNEDNEYDDEIIYFVRKEFIGGRKKPTYDKPYRFHKINEPEPYETPDDIQFKFLLRKFESHFKSLINLI